MSEASAAAPHRSGARRCRQGSAWCSPMCHLSSSSFEPPLRKGRYGPGPHAGRKALNWEA